MCANYIPSTRDELAEHFGVRSFDHAYPPEAFPGYLAPILRPPHEDRDSDRVECVTACFGMVPHWAKPELARQTYNARSETVAAKPSYRNAWKKGQFCIVPLHAFFEPCYESGKPVRWKIAHAKDRPIGVAGIWEWRPDGEGNDGLVSFSMLTINADEHPLMRRFHKPGDEKRMLVVLDPSQYQAWLHATPANAPDWFVPYPAEQLMAEPAPKPPGRGKKPDLADAA